MCIRDRLEATYQKAHFDLRILLHDAGEDLSGELEYASDLFDRKTIERMLEHWSILLQSMADDDTQTICRLPWLPAAERQQVVHGFNATEAAYPQSRLIHELFEAQVRAQPEAEALRCEGERLSYAALNLSLIHI